MLRSTPPGEDPVGDARVSRVGFFAQGAPPGEDGLARRSLGEGGMNTLAGQGDLYQRTLDAATPPGAAEESAPESRGEVDYLHLISIAEQQANLYVQQVNRRAWSRSYRAFHNEHFAGSKYGHRAWSNRSKIFRPKTRSAVRKDGAAVAASLFGTVDAISCSAGDEADPGQRAAAALMQELINYRTDRTSGRNAIPWFLVAMGARQDAQIAGICASKQYWRLELRKSHDEELPFAEMSDVRGQRSDARGQMSESANLTSDIRHLSSDSDIRHLTSTGRTRPVYVPDIDRPDIRLFSP